MTEEEKYDRWERFARLFYERSIRESRESRRQTASLTSYVDAQREYQRAKLAAAAKPEDLQATETLRSAIQILDRAREELRR